MGLSKAKILSANDVKVSEPIPVKEWGGDVYVKTITGLERDAFEESYSEQKMKSFRVKFLVLTLCDETGERLFGDDDVALLGTKSSNIINALFEKSWAHNAFNAEAVEEMGKDSPGVQSEGSTSN